MRLDAIPLFALSASSGEGSPSGLVWVVPYVAIFVIFYFLLIAPARKKQKLHAEMLERLKPGDKVVTTGGLYGTVVSVTAGVVSMRIAEKVKIQVARSAVAGTQETEQE